MICAMLITIETGDGKKTHEKNGNPHCGNCVGCGADSGGCLDGGRLGGVAVNGKSRLPEALHARAG